jgi:glycine hydroxymethyltransferase
MDVAATFSSALRILSSVAPSIVHAIADEFVSQQESLKLIASENHCSLAVQLAQANLLTDKYAEGSPGNRFYAGCENPDRIESEAANLACQLFGADHAFVQPHSGADANLVAFMAFINWMREDPDYLAKVLGEPIPGGQSAARWLREHATRAQWNRIRNGLAHERVLAMDFASGGHLTHGYRPNISAQLFDFRHYRVQPRTGLLDLSAVRRLALEERPKVLLAGYSAYTRKIDFAEMRSIAEEVGAFLMVDMAHFAGLVAGGVLCGNFNPVPFAHIVTSTTHKTLRGPRGGIVLCQKPFIPFVDKACPNVLGGPIVQMIAAKAVAFREALTDEFRRYSRQVVDNAVVLGETLKALGVELITGGTENHQILVNASESFGLTGVQAESALRQCLITCNRNPIPIGEDSADPLPPTITSGLRFGTAALTTRGFGPDEMRSVGRLLHAVLRSTRPQPGSRREYGLDELAARDARETVGELTRRFPLYPGLSSVMAEFLRSFQRDPPLIAA